MRMTTIALCLMSALGTPALAQAAQDPTQNTPPASSLAELTARINALEANARALQQQADQALAAAHQAQAELQKMQADKQQQQIEQKLAAVSKKSPPTQASGIGTGNAFNPAIAVILNGYYANHSLNEGDYALQGFPAGGEAGPLAQGLSMGESEIALSANIDDKFYGQLTLSVESEDGEDHIGVEEAYIDTTALPAGLGVRAGRFYSDIGYLNSHHTHTDFFSVRPLVYQAFLGNQYGDDGVRVQWVAPTNLYVQVGGEVFRGQNYPTAGAGHGGTGAHTLFLHTGGDVGIRNAWYAGVSMLRASTHDADDGFSGRNTVYIADGTWKWSRHGNFKDGGVLLRGEYMLDKRDGNYSPSDSLIDVDNSGLAALPQDWTGKRRGLYLEGVYNFNRTWSTGYRYDRLWADEGGPFASPFDPWKHSVMLTWRNSEFSLFRLQYSREKPASDQADNALILQYQVALGAHGAHKF